MNHLLILSHQIVAKFKVSCFISSLFFPLLSFFPFFLLLIQLQKECLRSGVDFGAILASAARLSVETEPTPALRAQGLINFVDLVLLIFRRTWVFRWGRLPQFDLRAASIFTAVLHVNDIWYAVGNCNRSVLIVLLSWLSLLITKLLGLVVFSLLDSLPMFSCQGKIWQQELAWRGFSFFVGKNHISLLQEPRHFLKILAEGSLGNS